MRWFLYSMVSGEIFHEGLEWDAAWALMCADRTLNACEDFDHIAQ